MLVDGARLEYYNLPSDSVAAAQGSQWLDAKAVFDTIEAVSQGQVKPKSSRSYIDRGVQGANHALDAIIVSATSLRRDLSDLRTSLFRVGS